MSVNEIIILAVFGLSIVLWAVFFFRRIKAAKADGKLTAAEIWEAVLAACRDAEKAVNGSLPGAVKKETVKASLAAALPAAAGTLDVIIDKAAAYLFPRHKMDVEVDKPPD